MADGHSQNHYPGTNVGSELGGRIRGAWTGFHDASESIRGNSMRFLENLLHDASATACDKAIARRGAQEMRDE